MAYRCTTTDAWLIAWRVNGKESCREVYREASGVPQSTLNSACAKFSAGIRDVTSLSKLQSSIKNEMGSLRLVEKSSRRHGGKSVTGSRQDLSRDSDIFMRLLSITDCLISELEDSDPTTSGDNVRQIEAGVIGDHLLYIQVRSLIGTIVRALIVRKSK